MLVVPLSNDSTVDTSKGIYGVSHVLFIPRVNVKVQQLVLTVIIVQ